MLDQILEFTRADLAIRRREVPASSLLAAAQPACRPFGAALRSGRTAYILECKRASPSEGVLRDFYDPTAIAREYAPFASAISVLTNRPFFHGSLAHLTAVREAVDVPVLRKDFIVDPYQVLEARAHGADAVLLMLSALDDIAWRECSAAATDAGLETLTEVHADVELDRALALGAPIIGINNRNLHTLRLDMGTVRRLAPRIPGDRVVVCESGIRSHAEVRELAALADAFLVGTTLMREAELGGGVRRLIFGVTKVCGLTRPADARVAWREGAVFGGMIFAPESSRAVTPETARDLARAAPLRWVGVFVNEAPERVAGIARELGLSAVQLHGEEDAATVEATRRALGGTAEVWKGVRVQDRVPRLAETGADRLVLDTWRDGQRGGTGDRFDWSLLHTYEEKDRILLGGGLTPEVAARAEAIGCFGLDVNSGVEEAPGRKSAERLAAFFAARRGAGRVA